MLYRGWDRHVLYAEVTQSLDSARRTFDCSAAAPPTWPAAGAC
jgi:hypothetical protein